MKHITGYRITSFAWILWLCLGQEGFASEKDTQAGPSSPQDALIDQITQEVVKRLQTSEMLNQAIDAAIQRHIQKQVELEKARKAEQVRLAHERIKQVRRVDQARDHIRGDREAEITLIEYSDFQCPFCKRFHSTAQDLVQEYSGIANWVYRHFPMESHNPRAQKESEASECAYELGRDDVFWKFADALFASPQSEGKGFAQDAMLSLAREQGIPEGPFLACLNNGSKARRVSEDLEEGIRIGVTGTPTTIIYNNRTGEVGLLVVSSPNRNVLFFPK